MVKESVSASRNNREHRVKICKREGGIEDGREGRDRVFNERTKKFCPIKVKTQWADLYSFLSGAMPTLR